MKRFGQLGKLSAATILSCALSLGVASVAEAAPAPAPVSTSVSASLSSDSTALLIVDGHATAVPSTLQQNIDTAGWLAKLPALKRGLARGESLAVASQEAGLPAITGHAVSGSTAKGGVQPMSGASCQDWTCGWQFDAVTSYYISWLVWAGVITGPGLVCGLLGPPSLGTACLVAGALWSIISNYIYTYPSYTGRCIYIGIGLGTVAKWEHC